MTPPPANTPLLVALGSEAQALRLIHAAFWSAREGARPWTAAHVELPDEDGEARDQARLWMEEAQSLGAELLWLKDRTLAGGLLKAVRATGATELLMGQGKGHWPWDRLGHSTAQELIRRKAPAKVIALPLGTELQQRPALPPKGARLGALLGGAGILGICTGLAAILPPGMPLPAIFLLFLAGTATIAQKWGPAAGYASVLLSVALFQTGFAQDGGLASGSGLTLVALFLMVTGGGQFVVRIAERLEAQTHAARRRSALLAALLLLGRHLARAATPVDVADALSHLGQRLIHRPIELVLPFSDAVWRVAKAGESAAVLIPASTMETLCNSSTTGPLEPRIHEGHAYLPLGQGGASEGALRVPLEKNSELREENWELLQAFAVQVALALERAQWLEKAQAARVESETERTRNTLLGSISHDLRTPLAAIQGAASSLLLAKDTLPEGTRRDMLAMIHDESERLSQLLCNLLDLTRLECGAILARREWQPLDEVVGAALRRAESRHGPLQVLVSLPEDLPMVPLDEALMEQLLMNLLANARRHAPESAIELKAWAGDHSMEMEIADRGPGIPPEFRERVFDKFFQLPGNVQEGGAGLGLAICQAIAKIHEGRIWVEGRSGGGTAFRVSLPLPSKMPDLPEPERP